MDTSTAKAKNSLSHLVLPAEPRQWEDNPDSLRIVDFNNNFSFTGGGIRTYHTHKIDYFARRDDVHYSLIVPSDWDGVEYHGNARMYHIKAPLIPGAGNYRSTFNPLKLRRILEEISPDLIEVGGPYVDPFLVRYAANREKTVVIDFWHTHYPDVYLEYYGNRISKRVGKTLKKAGWMMARQTRRFFDATFVAADSMIADLRQNGIERIIQCPLGVEIDKFHPDFYDRGLRKSVGAENRPLVFFPHRLLQEKGILQVVAAIPIIARQKDAVFVFAGDGPEYPMVKQLVEEREDCHYLGFITSREEMARWLASSDIIYGLSAWETFGLSIIEAMASGVPVIAANAGAARDWVERARCGVTVERSAETVAQATVDLLNRPDLSTLGRRGRQFVKQHFSWETTFERQLGYYVQLIEAKRSRQTLDGFPYLLDTETPLESTDLPKQEDSMKEEPVQSTTL